jgi:hypothetical protein
MTNMSRFPLLYLAFLHIASEGHSASLPSFAFALSTYNKYFALSHRESLDDKITFNNKFRE